jgi:hypothetical protein
MSRRPHVVFSIQARVVALVCKADGSSSSNIHSRLVKARAYIWLGIAPDAVCASPAGDQSGLLRDSSDRLSRTDN